MSLGDLLTIFNPEPKDDYELIFAYKIEQEDATKLKAFLKENINFDFENTHILWQELEYIKIKYNIAEY